MAEFKQMLIKSFRVPHRLQNL